MSSTSRYFTSLSLPILLLLASQFLFHSAQAQPKANPPSTSKFELVETTISDIHRAFRAGTLTSEQLVKAYLDRIQAYDQPTKLNSIILVNPEAIATARALGTKTVHSFMERK